SSTAAAITDIHGDETAKSDSAKSDSSASDTAQAVAPPADPSANPPIPVAQQPVAIAVSEPVIAAAPITIGGGSGSDAGTGQDATQITALSDAVKAGASR